MINFQYNPSEYEEKSFQVIPEGDHRVRIAEAVEQTSSTGKQMIKFTLDVSGYSSSLWYYLVFDPSNSKMTNQKIGDFFKSFDITNPNLNEYPRYIGRVGACRVKHEEYNGEKSPKVWYFLNKTAQAKLPAWKEPVRANDTQQPMPPVTQMPQPQQQQWQQVTPSDPYYNSAPF